MNNLGRREQVLILIVVAVVLFTAGYQFANHDQKPVELIASSSVDGTQEEVGPVVHVDGAVEKPGVYRLPVGSRVGDALAQAVALPEANLSLLNLAAPLKDGQKLVVASHTPSSVTDSPDATTSPKPILSNAVSVGKSLPTTKQGGLVNINTAGVAELDTLPGIGPALAQRIIQYREANGSFSTIEELKNVSGIGDKKFADLEPKVTVQ